MKERKNHDKHVTDIEIRKKRDGMYFGIIYEKRKEKMTLRELKIEICKSFTFTYSTGFFAILFAALLMTFIIIQFSVTILFTF